VWGDFIGLDLENKPQWDTYNNDYFHHGEPGHISKNLLIKWKLLSTFPDYCYIIWQ
jgi:hypothetical protein